MTLLYYYYIFFFNLSLYLRERITCPTRHTLLEHERVAVIESPQKKVFYF